MFSEEQAAELRGLTLLDASEQEVGPVDEVFLLPADDQAAFAAVLIEGKRVLVPLDEADLGDGRLVVRYESELIAGAPEAAEGEAAVGPELETAIYEHYGISDATLRDDTGFSSAAPTARTQGSSRDPRGDGGADDASVGHP
jgi:hypothetical protein